MRIKTFLPLVFLALCCVSCSDSDEPETKSKSCIDVAFNETFALEVGGEYCFPDGSELTVVAFRNEFCPCNVDCIQPGTMVVEMIWTDGIEVVELEYFSASAPSYLNVLPNDAVITGLDEDIEFITPCTSDNGSPDIIGAKIMVSI